jgi:DNA-binding HxlR family transcriptional regulator
MQVETFRRLRIRRRRRRAHGLTARVAARTERFPRSRCPIANLLDIVGDKWSLLVVRDLFRGNATYSELLDAPEKIPTNILAERLKRLEKAGLVAKSPYRQRPLRHAYRLTKKGEDLRHVLVALVRWGNRHVAGASQTLDFRRRKRTKR